MSLDALQGELELLLAAWGYELVLMRYNSQARGGYLRLLIDKPGGIAVADCETVSKQVGAYLDVVDPIPQRYMLEVSSPGLNRPLTKEEHLLASVGQRVALRLTALSGGSRRLQGVLRGVGEDALQVEVDGRILPVAREKIREATLLYDWDQQRPSLTPSRRAPGNRPKGRESDAENRNAAGETPRPQGSEGG